MTDKRTWRLSGQLAVLSHYVCSAVTISEGLVEEKPIACKLLLVLICTALIKLYKMKYYRNQCFSCRNEHVSFCPLKKFSHMNC